MTKKSKDKKREKSKINLILSIAAIILLGALVGVAFWLFVGSSGGFILKYKTLITVCGFIIIAVLTAASIVFQLLDKDFVFRLSLSFFVLLVVLFLVMYVLKITGFWDKISTVEDLRNYIASVGSKAVLIALLMQVLQVVVLPIPGVIAIGATVALFGALKGALISFTGIFIGSLIGFFIGRKLGYKAASWLVGEDSLKTARRAVEGKDKIFLTFMFLFPFFPDDVLCFVAGLSTMSVKYYLVMITFTRLFSVFTTAYSVNGNLIPYDNWWGILIWAVLIIGTFLLATYIYKNSEKFTRESIRNYFQNLRKNRKK